MRSSTMLGTLGRLAITAVADNISTLISACFLAIVGVQLVSFGAISWHYAGLSGFLPPSRGPAAVMFRYAQRPTTSHVCGFVIAMVGAGVFGYALRAWAARGFGPPS